MLNLFFHIISLGTGCLIALGWVVYLVLYFTTFSEKTKGHFPVGRVSRIGVVSVMGLGALDLLITGPRPETKPPEGREHDVVVQYWEKWVGDEGAKMKVIVDDFNDTVGKKKHIYVQYLSMSQIDQKTIVAVAAGDPPDVAGLWDHEVAPMGAMGALMPLDELAGEHGITASYYKPVYWKACCYHGKLYALVSTPAAVALFYNKKMFQDEAKTLRAAGLDPDQAPQTLQDLDRYAAALDTYSTGPDGKPHVERAGYLPMEPGWWMYTTPLWFGTDIWDSKNHKFLLTDPRVVAAFTWVQSYSKKYGEDAITEFSNGVQGQFNSPANPFMVGRIAMEQQGSWMANYIHQNRPSFDPDWAAAPFPSADGRKMVTWCPIDLLMIPRGCKHPKEAFEFIAFVNRQDEMEKLNMLHCKDTPLSVVSENFLNHHPNPYIRVLEDLSNSPNAYASPDCPVSDESRDEINAMVQGLVTDVTKDPATELKKSQDRLQAIYDDFERKQQMRGLE